MDYSEKKRNHKHMHRLGGRGEPNRRIKSGNNGYAPFRHIQQRFTHNVYRVAEKAAEHQPPKHCGNPAEEEHLNALSETFLHIFKMLQRPAAGKRHYKTVAGVGKHYSEKEIIEYSHN